jgi:hypothetical protein
LVGNGASIDIWKYPWIPWIPCFLPKPKLESERESLVVACLIDQATGRGGQKIVDPDSPDQSGRPARPSARPLAYIWMDTDTVILNIRITDR